MAIDTKEKRAAVLGVGRPWVRDKFPVATPDEEWRISSGNAYGGNPLSAIGAVLDNAKFSLLSYQQPFNSAVPAPVGGSLTQGDNQHLMWQYAGIDWAAVGVADIMAQARTVSRLVFSRVFGRVN